MLAQAAKRSLAFNAENASKRHADIAAAKAKEVALKAANDANDNASSAHDSIDTTDGNLRNTDRIARRNMEAISNAFLSLGVSLSYEYVPETCK